MTNKFYATLLQDGFGYWGVGSDHGKAEKFLEKSPYVNREREPEETTCKRFMLAKGDDKQLYTMIQAYEWAYANGFVHATLDEYVKNRQSHYRFVAPPSREKILEGIGSDDLGNAFIYEEAPAKKVADIHNLKITNDAVKKAPPMTKYKDINRLKFDMAKQRGD